MGKLAGRGKTVTGTTRQLESMIRLAEAHARMRLSPIVQPVDVDEAHRYFYLIKDYRGGYDVECH